MKIAFVGGGAMGESMVKCLLTKKVAAPQDMVVSDVNHLRRELLSREYGVNTLAPFPATCRSWEGMLNVGVVSSYM